MVKIGTEGQIGKFFGNTGNFNLQGGTLQVNGGITVSGSIIPLTSGTFDLGSNLRPWQDLHILGSTIHFYTASKDSEGNPEKLSRLRMVKNKGIQLLDPADDNTLTFISASHAFFSDAVKSPFGSFRTGSFGRIDHAIMDASSNFTINGGSF